MINWIFKNYIEVTGSLLGLIYIVLSIRRNISLWLVGFLTSAFYMVVFYHSKIYANMTLQFYYLIMSVYGWFSWRLSGNGPTEEEKVTTQLISKKIAMICLILGLLVFFPMYKLLDIYTDSPFPGWDTLTTLMSIIATWMLTKKYLENWLLWIVTDAISVGLYVYMKLYPTGILFFVYTVMAVVGYLEWKKHLSKAMQP